MKDRVDLNIKQISFLCFMLDLILYTNGAGLIKNPCKSAVTIESGYSRKILRISQNGRDFKDINIVGNSCIYDLDMYGWAAGGLQIAFETNDISKSEKCRAFSSIYFKVGKVGKPVKTLSCDESGNWTVPWPKKRVVVGINLAVNSTENHLILNASTKAILTLKMIYMSGSIGYKKYKQQVEMTVDRILPRVPQLQELCLGDFYYKITFKRSYLGGNMKRKLKFLLVDKSVCIKTYAGGLYETIFSCPWKINIKIGGELLMVLDCNHITKYWCLPESWIKKSGEWLEIYFSSYARYSKYTITLSSNETKSAYRNFSCPITTTTTTTTTVRYHSFDSGVDYNSRRHSSSSAIYIPIIGLLVFIFAFICGASYIRSHRHHSNYESRMSQRSHITYRDADDDEAPRNPAYRRHDPVRGPDLTLNGTNRTDNYYSDPPPNYAGVMASAPPDYREQLTTTITSPTASVPIAPPPSYEEALTMSGGKNSSNI